MTEAGRAKRDYAGDYARFVLRHRQAVLLVCVLLTALAAWYLDRINLRNDPDSLLPLSNPYVATNLYAELTYGMGNIMVWGMKVKQGDIYQPWFIEMAQAFYNDVSALDYANSNNFVGIASGKLRNIGLSKDGSLDFKRLLPSNGLARDPETAQAQIAYLRQGLEKHLVLEPLLLYYQDDVGAKCDLVDEQGLVSNASVAHVHEHCVAMGTFIIGDFGNELKDDYLDWFADVKTLMANYESRYGDRVEFTISGEPYFLAAMVKELWDKAWLFAVSLLIVVVLLWYQFRHWSCAVLPLVGVGMTIVLTLGLMGYTEFKLTTMMVLTPMLLLAIGIGHSMQITRRFMQELHLHGDPERAAEESIRHTIVPAFLSIGTDLHGFFAISFVDISFYKAYAYFGIFGMATLLITTTTLIPLMMISIPPKLHDHEDERPWEQTLARGMARLLTGPAKWLPAAAVLAVLWISAHYAELGRGLEALWAGEAGRGDPEVARIQDEFDIMPGAEKGINYPRAAFKDTYWLGGLFGDDKVKPIADLETLSAMMPGVITANLVIRSRAGVLPQCGLDAWSDDGERLKGPDVCFDPQEDPAQGIFNDAQVLAALAEFEDWLRAHPYIGFTASYVQFVRTLNMVLNAPTGEPPQHHLNLYAIPSLEHLQANRYAYEQGGELPDPDASVQLYNGILANTAGPGELDSFVNTRTWDEGIIVGFVNTMEPAQAHQAILDIQNYIAAHRHDPGMDRVRIGLEDGEKVQVRIGTGSGTITTDDTLKGKAAVGGFLGVTEATRDVAFAEWLHAPLMTSATVFAMTAIMFRSVLIAGLLIGLCFITLMSQYGLAGYMTSIGEWSANLAFHVQVALSIAMGLGIDYSVYMVSRLREEMQSNNMHWPTALRETLTGTGSAVLISVAVLLGSLIPLMNTELANTWSVSLYIGEALILDVLTALMLLPLLFYWLKPRFVFRP